MAFWIAALFVTSVTSLWLNFLCRGNGNLWFTSYLFASCCLVCKGLTAVYNSEAMQRQDIILHLNAFIWQALFSKARTSERDSNPNIKPLTELTAIKCAMFVGRSGRGNPDNEGSSQGSLRETGSDTAFWLLKTILKIGHFEWIPMLNYWTPSDLVAYEFTFCQQTAPQKKTM